MVCLVMVVVVVVERERERERESGLSFGIALRSSSRRRAVGEEGGVP